MTIVQKARLAGRAGSGPALIVLAVLLVLRNYAFRPLIEGGDMATYWLPLHCFMGHSLQGGHIPSWDPYAMSGMPFASDPQAGWLSFPAMVMFSLFPCGIAIRWLMIFVVALAGLGAYWFLRGERASRVAATCGGLALAVVLARSSLAPSFRFPGSIAWTAICLGAVGQFLRSDVSWKRVAWLAAAALAWGQLAAAYLGLGLLVGTTTLGAYLVWWSWRSSRRGSLTTRRALLRIAPLAPAFVLVNLAYLLPRLVNLPRLNVSLGYGTMLDIAVRDLGRAAESFPGPAAGPAWPLNLGLVPGPYLGSVLLLSFAAFWSRRRGLALAMASVAAACYVGSLGAVARAVPQWMETWTVIDQYLHRPHRLIFGVLLPLCVLAALGVDAVRLATSWRARFLLLAPGVLIWILLPLGLGAPPRRLAVLAAAGAAFLSLLWVSRRMPLAAVGAMIVLVLDLVSSTFVVRRELTFEPASRLLEPVVVPTLDVNAYLHPTAIARALREAANGRYMTLGRSKRFGALQTGQSILYEIEGTGGYLSIQLERYWRFIRSTSDLPMRHQYAFFERPPPTVLDLLQVNWLIASQDDRANVEPGANPVAADGPWTLYRRAREVPRASAVFDWAVVSSADEARRRVAEPDFDPSAEAILEEDPGIRPAALAPGSGSVRYVARGPQAADVRVDLPAPAIVLVRNVWHPNWRADVDGRPAPVLVVDSVVQGIAVPAGQHSIELRYLDPTIGWGLLGSGASICTLGILAVALRRRHLRSPQSS